MGILGKTRVSSGGRGQAHLRQEKQEPSMNSLELDTEIGKMARAMMTRNTQIGTALIDHLRTQLTLESVAGVLLVSINRLLWLDTDSVI